MTVELPPSPSGALKGHHHVTTGVGDPQGDFDFHTKVLGLKCCKRTLFYDGATPVYHFYYGNDVGEESTLPWLRVCSSKQWQVLLLSSTTPISMTARNSANFSWTAFMRIAIA